MAYPGMTDYQDVLQDPAKAFNDPILKRASVATSPLGLPVPMSGGFAITYRLDAGASSYAVRCFHREIPGVNERYAFISKVLGSHSSDYFAAFDFQPAGILVNGSRYPIVKMDWMQGETLDAYLERHALDKSRMNELRVRFRELASWLQTKGIAHGDLQNGNVVVGQSKLKLIDYDGMFVPGMATSSGTEVGHKHFQHPGRTVRDFGPLMDRFAFIVIDLSLEALAADPSLHRRFREGGEAIIFKANDFADPDGSEVFNALRAITPLRDHVDRFAKICAAPIQLVPVLEDYLSGTDIPEPVRKSSPATGLAKSERSYIGAYPVVAGSDYEAVLCRVGDRIEIVGKVVSVKQGIGRRGRGRNRPYVFINFGVWNQKSVKITIWSEGLSAMDAHPDDSWIGRWLSVTGLVEPPYEGAHYGKPYFSVGVTLTSDSQLVQIGTEEAGFRLGLAGKKAVSPKRATPTNSTLVQSLSKGGRARTLPRGRAAPTATPQPLSANAALVASLNPAASTTAKATAKTPSISTSATMPVASARASGGWANWFGWMVVIGFVLFLLTHCRG
jgi:hypothetical protein